jgi:hypothetical protein
VSRPVLSDAVVTITHMSGLITFLAQPSFWWGGLAGTLITGVVAPLITARSLRASDARKATQDERMHKLKVDQEELTTKRQLLRETATNFTEVCSGVIEKVVDSKSVFNSVLDAVQNMEGQIDKKALEKIECAIDVGDQAKRITTAYNKLRVVAPGSVLHKATALNAAMLALTQTLTVPLARPPVLQQASNAFEGFMNAVRAELGLDAFTGEEANKSRTTYMETLTEQMQDYIKETQEQARRFGFLEPGAVPITTIKARDLAEEHVGKFVGCHDPTSGFNYGAKILKVIRNEEHRNPGMLVRIQHPPIPGGKPARQERMRLRFEQEVQLVELPNPSGV